MVRRLRAGEIPAAVELVNAEDWPFAPEDFEAMLDLEPDGLFCVEVDGEVVGLTTTAGYDGLGWIGNVVVAPDHRGQGLGTELVEAAVDHLRSGGADTVGLYALPASYSLYERVGFEPRHEVVAFSGEADGEADPPEGDLETVVEIDRRHVARDRSRYLRHLATQEGVRVAVGTAGYVVARPGRVWELGPAVHDPDRPEALADLVDRVLASIAGPVEASFPVDAPARSVYEERGLTAAYGATTMTIGDGPLYETDAVAGLLGLEKG